MSLQQHIASTQMPQYTTIAIRLEEFCGRYHLSINGRPIAYLGESGQDAEKFMHGVGDILHKHLHRASEEISAMCVEKGLPTLSVDMCYTPE